MGRCGLLVVLAAAGCGDGAVAPPPGGAGGGDSGCVAGELLLEDGSCLPAGVQLNGCSAGELHTDQGCVPAGVPADGCAAGFVHDGDRGCAPIMPATSCAPGLVALPGERSCRELLPCGTGRWGDIPVDAATVHVDGAYAGTSDGTETMPFTTIQAAVDAAPPGALIAVAEGSYGEDVRIDGKAVRVRGRCPALVEVVGTAAEPAAFFVTDGDGTEIGGLAVTGVAGGIELRASLAVALADLWVHDTGLRGISVLGDDGPASVELRTSLVESVPRLGVWVNGAAATIDHVVVRDVLPDADGTFGDGIYADIDTTSGRAPSLTMTSSVVERAHKVGIFVAGGEALIEATLVRDTLTGLDEPIGRGIQAQDGLGMRPQLELRGVVIERSVNAGLVLLAADALVESIVVRDTATSPDGTGGRGMVVGASPVTGEGSTIDLRQSLVEGCHEAGVFVAASEAVLAGVAVRDVQSTGGTTGEGIIVQPSAEVGGRSRVTVEGTLVERSHVVGFLVQGSDATVDGLLVRDTSPVPVGGIGLDVELAIDTGDPASAIVRSSVVERSIAYGISVYGADLTLEGTLIRDVAPSASGLFGDGVVASPLVGQAVASLSGVRVEAAARAGIASFGASVAVADSALECNPIDLAGQDAEGLSSEYDDRGNNHCGCGEAIEICRVLAAELEPPEPLGPAAP